MKKRIEKILNSKHRKNGVAILMVMALIIAMFSACYSANTKDTQNGSVNEQSEELTLLEDDNLYQQVWEKALYPLTTIPMRCSHKVWYKI